MQSYGWKLTWWNGQRHLLLFHMLESSWTLYDLIFSGINDLLFLFDALLLNFKNIFTVSFFQVVTDILHLQGQQLTAYRGNYDTFERTREEQLKNQTKAFESHERARAHMQVLVHKCISLILFLSVSVFVRILSPNVFMFYFCWDLDQCFFFWNRISVIHWQVPL